MKSRILFLALTVGLSIGAVSCSDNDEVANVINNATLTLKASSDKFISQNKIVYEQADIFVEEVEFESVENKDDDFEVDFKGPFEIDLLTGTSQPLMPSAYLMPGMYNEVELELEDDIEPSIYVKGSYSVDNETSLNFAFISSEEITFMAVAEDIAQPYLFEVVNNESIDIVLEFVLDDWFKDVDIAEGTVSANDMVIISKELNTSLFYQVIRNIKQSKLLVSTK